jgi:hypothetical protein
LKQGLSQTDFKQIDYRLNIFVRSLPYFHVLIAG